MWEHRCRVAVSGVGFSRVTRSAEIPLAAHALACQRAYFLPRGPDDPDWGAMAEQAVELALGWAPELAETHLAAARWTAQFGDYRGAATALRLGFRNDHHPLLYSVPRQLFDDIIGGRGPLEHPDVATNHLRPAQPRHQIIGPDGGAEDVCGMDEKRIARCVTKRVVDLLEAVEVDMQNADFGASPAAAVRNGL